MKITSLIPALCLAAALASAQDNPRPDKKQKKEEATHRSVEGIVMDSGEKPIKGAVVELKDDKTLQVRSFITIGDDGKYHFYGLKIDQDYQVKANYNGQTSGWRRISLFDDRKLVTMNLKVEKKEEKTDEKK